MANVGYATMQVIPSLKGVSANIGKQLGTQMGRAGDAAGAELGRRTGQSFNKMMLNLAARVTGAWVIGNALNKAFDFATQAFIGFNSQIEQSRVAFNNMLGAGRQTEALLKSLRDLGTGSTIFGVADAMRFGQQLLGMGVNAKKLVPTLKIIGDTAASLGAGQEGVARLSRAIGQMTAKGKIQGDELLQLHELGVPALQLLAQAYGKTNIQMSKMVTEGKVLSDVALPKLLAGLNKMYGGGDAARAKTFAGGWDIIRESMTAAIGDATLPLFNRLSSAMQALAGSGLVEKFGAGLANGLDRVTKLLSSVDWSPITGAFKDIGGAVGNLVPLVRNLWTIFGPVIQTVAGVAVGAFVALAAVLKRFTGDLVSATGWLSQFSGWIQPIAIGILAVVAAMKVWSIAMAVARGITIAFTAAQAALNVVLALNPIGLIVLAVIGLAAAFIFAWKKSETFRTVVLAVLNALKVAGIAVWNAIKVAAVAVFNFLKPVITAWVAYASFIWTAIKTAAVAVWSYIGPYVKLVISGLMTSIRVYLVVAKAVWTAIMAAAKVAWSLITTYTKVWFTVAKAVFGAWLAYARAVWSAISAAGKAVWTALSAAVKAWVTVVKTVLSNMRAVVGGIFGGAHKWLRDAGAKIIEGLIDGIKSGFNKVKDTLGGLTKLLPDWKGPAATDKRILKPAGRLVIGGFIEGMESQYLKAARSLAGLTGYLGTSGLDAAGGGGRGPLVGSLTLAGSGNTHDDLEEVNFQLRRIERGGPHA